jgi:hypothetical protein
VDYSHYGPAYLDQDLRRLNDTAFNLLWRVNPAAMMSTPDWLPALLATSGQRAAWELMSKLLLILDEIYDIETTPLTNNWSMSRGKIRKTGYPLRYVEDDLHNLQRGLSELSLRLHRNECRKIGPEVPRRRLRWLAEGAIARAEPILDAVKEPADIARAEMIDHLATLQQRKHLKHMKPRRRPPTIGLPLPPISKVSLRAQ